MRHKATTEEYEFTPDDIKKLIAKELHIPLDCVNIDFVVERVYEKEDWCGSFDATYEMTKANAIVTNTIEQNCPKFNGVMK